MIRALEIPGLQGTQVNAPQVSPSAAAAPAAALGSVASAISGVSDTFAGIADRIQRTENARAESETRNTWMLGWSDIQLQLQKEPDPAQHIALTRDWLQQQRGTLDAPDLAPVVRDRLLLQFDDFATRATNSAAEGAAQLATRRAGLALQNEIDAAERSGNDAQLDRALTTGRENGVLLPEQEEKIRTDYQHTKQRNQLLTQAATDPLSILDGTKPEGMNDLEWLDIQATARRANAQETSIAADEILDGIITGNITTPEQIDDLTPGLRPAAKESLKRHLADRANENTRALKASPAYQASAVAKVQEMLNDFTVDADGYDEAYVEMARIVRDLPPGAVRDELTRNLETSRSGQVKVIETAADYHRQSLNDLHQAGAFGTGLVTKTADQILTAGLLKDTAKLQARGFTPEQAEEIAGQKDNYQSLLKFRELAKDKPGFDYTSGFDQQAFDLLASGKDARMDFPDLAAREKQRRAYGHAKTKLEDWLKRNPNATEEQGREALLRITGETAIPGMVDQILEAPPTFGDGMVLPPKPEP
jgi:hypothetical protein